MQGHKNWNLQFDSALDPCRFGHRSRDKISLYGYFIISFWVFCFVSNKMFSNNLFVVTDIVLILSSLVILVQLMKINISDGVYVFRSRGILLLTQSACLAYYCCTMLPASLERRRRVTTVQLMFVVILLPRAGVKCFCSS